MGGFDPQYGVKISGAITSTSTGDTYATHDSWYGLGGYREVADLTERDGITAERRKEGMLVYVIATSTVYQLVGGVANTDWVIFEAGGSGGGATAVTTTYDNTTSGMVATNTQEALDELEGRVQTNETILSALDEGKVGTKTVDETDIAEGKILQYDELADVLKYVTNAGGAGGGVYTNADPIPEAIGGVEVGETFTDVALVDMWTKLLYPYQYPAFTSFSIATVQAIYEVGDTIAGGTYTFNWATSNSANVKVDTIAITDVTDGNTVMLTASANDGTEDLAQTAVTKTTATTHQWKIEGTNTKETVFDRTFIVNWQHRIYYGESALASLAEADIKALRISELKAGRQGTYNMLAGGYKYWAFPQSMGTPTSWIDPDTTFPVAMDTAYNIDITNSFGVLIPYTVYRTYNTLGGSIRVTVS